MNEDNYCLLQSSIVLFIYRFALVRMFSDEMKLSAVRRFIEEPDEDSNIYET